MSWIQHNGMGCPVPWRTIVETIDPCGEKHTGRADDQMNVCEYGNSWIWEDEAPSDCEISAFRIIAAKPVEKQLAYTREPKDG